MSTTAIPEPRIILPDTSLCAIVRDEIMNPAGGVVDFVDSTLPYVEAGVIVDTGSKDGTREALEEMKSKYSHLEVYDTKFQGFAHARNYSLKQAKTKRALVLDADERLTKNDFQDLGIQVDRYPKDGFNFEFLFIDTKGSKWHGSGLNPRLFHRTKIRFEREIWEFRKKRDFEYVIRPIGIEIKHFVPDEYSLDLKKTMFYRGVTNYTKEFECDNCGQKVRNWIKNNMKPRREFDFFQELRKYNPKREEYR